jgi:hypothetical protein
MKTLLLTVFLCLVATAAYPSPFLVCDSQAGVTTYTLTGPSWVPTTPISAQADGSIRFDVASAVVGNNSLTIKACKSDPVWGSQCSSATPFTFLRPSAPSVPSGAVLAP